MRANEAIHSFVTRCMDCSLARNDGAIGDKNAARPNWSMAGTVRVLSDHAGLGIWIAAAGFAATGADVSVSSARLVVLFESLLAEALPDWPERMDPMAAPQPPLSRRSTMRHSTPSTRSHIRFCRDGPAGYAARLDQVQLRRHRLRFIIAMTAHSSTDRPAIAHAPGWLISPALLPAVSVTVSFACGFPTGRSKRDS